MNTNDFLEGFVEEGLQNGLSLEEITALVLVKQAQVEATLLALEESK